MKLSNNSSLFLILLIIAQVSHAMEKESLREEGSLRGMYQELITKIPKQDIDLSVTSKETWRIPKDLHDKGLDKLCQELLIKYDLSDSRYGLSIQYRVRKEASKTEFFVDIFFIAVDLARKLGDGDIKKYDIQKMTLNMPLAEVIPSKNNRYITLYGLLDTLLKNADNLYKNNCRNELFSHNYEFLKKVLTKSSMIYIPNNLAKYVVNHCSPNMMSDLLRKAIEQSKINPHWLWENLNN